jgi:arogenate dehydrogenase (NADP+)
MHEPAQAPQKTVGIIGYGRFGKFWAKLLHPYFQIWITDHKELPQKNYLPLSELCSQVENLFICVPINQIEVLIEKIHPYLRPHTTLFDTCSVKSYPSRIFQKYLSNNPTLTLIATHPMFGPDSANKGIQGLPLVFWFLSGQKEIYKQWYTFFQNIGLSLVEISPEEHDYLAAYTQGVTHYIGRVLGELKLHNTPIDTQGFKTLHTLIAQTCNDSWELFYDLQNYNPYTQEMRLALEQALKKIYLSLQQPPPL